MITARLRRSRQAATVIANSFDRAAQNYALRGTYDPDQRDEIVDKYKNARSRLINHLMN